MRRREMKQLAPGDIVRRSGGSPGFVVTANYGERVSALRTVSIANPDEWSPATHDGIIDLRKLLAFRVGEVVASKGTAERYVVINVSNGHAIAVQGVEISAATMRDWEVVFRVTQRRRRAL